MRLKIYLLGQFKLTAGQQPVELPSRPAQSLLAFLALNAGVVHRREKLASLIWPDATEKNARGYLRQALWRIRKSLEQTPIPWKTVLDITDINVRFKDESDYWLDADAFLAQHDDETVEKTIEIVKLYQGELLPGFYDEWIQLERERFQSAYHQKMNSLLEMMVQQHNWAGAVQWSEDWIRLDNSPEPAYRILMRAYAGMGDQGMVSATYQRCMEALDRELGLDPSPETQQLYTKICCGELETSPPTPSPPPKKTRRIPDFLDGENSYQFETPVFVARENELQQLQAFLDHAVAGQGQVVFITGEAGSGKTALVNEFTHQANQTNEHIIIASGNCNAHTGLGDPYLPFREILELLTGDVKARWSAGAITKTQAQTLWNTLPTAARALVDAGPDLIGTFIAGTFLYERAANSVENSKPWLAQLNNLVAARTSESMVINPEKSDLLDQYTSVLRLISEEAPIVMVVDDLQWADLGSINLLFHLGTHLTGSRILVIGAYRPEEIAIGRDGERHPLSPILSELQRRYGDLELNLDQSENRNFVDALLDSEPNQLSRPFRDMLYRQTRGHPLFLTELLRGLQERGDLVKNEQGQWIEGPNLDWDTIPARVEAVITERIGRLPQSLQRVLRVASVEGEVFTVEALARVLTADEQELLNQLSEELDRKHRLVRAQSIQRIKGQLISNYRFRHIQIQKYLYNSLNPIERVHLHEQIGEALEKLHHVQGIGNDLAEFSLSDTPAIQLARHFEEAQVLPKAIHYLDLAGERAVLLSGYHEAITLLQKGQSLLAKMPNTPERSRLALVLQLSLGKAMKGATSMAMPEVEKIYTMARELVQEVGEPEQLWVVLGELTIVYFVRGEYVRAKDYAEEAFALAQELDDPVLDALSHWILGVIAFAMGEFLLSREHLGKILSFYDPEKHFERFVILRGVDAGLSAIAYDACCLWCLGYPDQAIQKSREALAKAERLNHPFTLADVLSFAGCVVSQLSNNPVALKEYADRLYDIADSAGLSWLAAGRRYRGDALAALGQVKEGLEEGKNGMSENLAIYTECCVIGMLGNIAFACANSGDFSTSSELMEEAFEIVHTRQERYYEAELYRKSGEIMWLQKDEQAAEEYYLKAIEVAQKQHARSFELRAATSLARLWQKQGKHAEAKKILSEVYAWFTEGFATPDLQAAKSLLDELG